MGAPMIEGLYWYIFTSLLWLGDPINVVTYPSETSYERKCLIQGRQWCATYTSPEEISCSEALGSLF